MNELIAKLMLMISLLWVISPVAHSGTTTLQLSDYTTTFDQATASSVHLDAVAFRVVLGLADKGDSRSVLASVAALTDGDLQVLSLYEEEKLRVTSSVNSFLCEGISLNPSDKEVVAFGARLTASVDQEDEAHAKAYRELLPKLTPTAAGGIRDYMNNRVLPSLKTVRVDFESLFNLDPNAFRSKVTATCHPKAITAGGKQR